MNNVRLFRSAEDLAARRNLREFIRHCRTELTWLADVDGFDWDSIGWPHLRWVKLGVGKRKRVRPQDALDPEFIDFAKAYYRWMQTVRPVRMRWDVQALRCLETALLDSTGSASIHGLTYGVLDAAAVAARARFTPQVRYHVGRTLGEIAALVAEQRLAPLDSSGWKSPFSRPVSVRQTGPIGRERIESKMPSEAGLAAMAEIFARDPCDPPTRFVSAVWALLLCAPWRIGEILRLHVDAEHEGHNDHGVLSYGLRYYGSKRFGHDVKWVPKVMEPVAREAFRRLREMTQSARDLARHLETSPRTPLLYPDAPRVGLDDPLSLDDKARYLRLPVPRGSVPGFQWQFPTIREHWAEAQARRPEGFPVFSKETGLRFSDALFCIHRDFLHETRPTDWYRLTVPTADTVNGLLKSIRARRSVMAKLGYTEPDGTPIKLTTHQARHYLSTIAERGAMAEEDLAKWAARAQLRDNAVYNHMTESERAERARESLAGTSLAKSPKALPPRVPTTPAEHNLGVAGPTHRTEFGVCEHDWASLPCTKNRDCVSCSEHMYFKGDAQSHERIKARHEHRVAESTKALDAIVAGTRVADRWLEHALKALVREAELLRLMEDDSIPDGSAIRLADESAEHTHLRRALAQRLPRRKHPVSTAFANRRD